MLGSVVEYKGNLSVVLRFEDGEADVASLYSGTVKVHKKVSEKELTPSVEKLNRHPILANYWQLHRPYTPVVPAITVEQPETGATEIVEKVEKLEETVVGTLFEPLSQVRTSETKRKAPGSRS